MYFPVKCQHSPSSFSWFNCIVELNGVGDYRVKNKNHFVMKTVKVLSYPFHCQNPDGYAIFIRSNISNCSMKDGVCRKHFIAFSNPLSICEVSYPSEA